MTKEQFITELSGFEGNIKAKAAYIYDRLFPVQPIRLKPFDLQRALAGDKVVMRTGQPVSEIVLLKTVPDDGYCVVSVVDGIMYWHYRDGECPTDDNDLFMAPTEVTGWVNVYKNIGPLGTQVGYRVAKTVYTEEGDAISCADDDLIATAPITFTI